MTKVYNLKVFSELGCSRIKTKSCVPVPSREIFGYIREKAMDGNEMAVVQLYEWTVLCSPKSSMEKKIYQSINYTFNKLVKA